ncbi:DNA adenine methylase [Vibrio mediterranei]|uniref:DNA adenine methylase n=1 Tax=Vibrio mediterranei TaxID=689 RepID=UPI00117C90D2|nr:DNA adenine methylase [Vibrio mediterranei]
MHTPVLRYHGGKYRLSKWLYGFFPVHSTYVEPYGGAASVLLRKARSHGEIYNDLDQDIFNLFCVLRDKESVERLVELCQLTPYSRDEFKLAYEFTEELRVWRLDVLVNQIKSMGFEAVDVQLLKSE